MAQRRFCEPQFDSSRHETWCFGIIYELHELMRQNEATANVNGLTLDEMRTEFKDHLDLPELRNLQPYLYEILLSAVANNVRKVCSGISDPFERFTFQSRFLENIFLCILNENELLTDSTKHYYESVLDIFPKTTFGLAFFVDFMSDQGWYKYGSKILAHFPDPNQVEIILTRLNEFSSNIHLTILKVLWSIERSLAEYNEYDIFMKFVVEASQLKEQSTAKTYNFRENLAIYLAILNVYLDAFFENTAKMAARERGIDKQFDPNDCLHHQSEVRISLQPVSSISNLIRDLEKILFPDCEYNNNEVLHDCFEDSKSAAILEMVAYISGIYEFLKIVAAEVKVLQLDKLKFEVYEIIESGWQSWKCKGDTVESSFWGILSLRRFFSRDCEESRFLTIAVINNGVPKYFDLLEEIPSEIYLDPYVMHALGLAIKKAERIKYMDNLILILKRVLKSVRFRRRIAYLFKTRVDLFGLHNYGEPHRSKLNLFLDFQQSGAIVYSQVRDDILLSAYLYPCEFIDQMFADVLEHRHTMLDFLCNLFCTELSPVCSSVVDTRFNNTFFECLLNSRLTIPPTEASLQGLMTVIKDIHAFYYKTKNPILPKILSLERLMLCLTWDGPCDPQGSIDAKFSVYKLIQNLSDADDIPWDWVKKNPQHILYNLVQYIDSFFNQPRRRGEIIKFIDFIMDAKVRRLLSDEEFIWMLERSEFHFEEKSLFGILGPYLKSSLKKFYPNFYAGNVIMIAAFSRDNIWLRYAHSEPIDDNVKLIDSIAVHMQFFSRQEYDNLFYFLCHFLRIDRVIAQLISAYHKQKDWFPLDVGFEIQCLCDCIEFHYENYFKKPELYECKRGKYRNQRLPREELNPLVFNQVDRMWNFRLASGEDEKRIGDLLRKLAEEMKELNIDAAEWFFQEGVPREHQLRRQSQYILRSLYGELYYRSKPYKEPAIVPAGYNYH